MIPLCNHRGIYMCSLGNQTIVCNNILYILCLRKRGLGIICQYCLSSKNKDPNRFPPLWFIFLFRTRANPWMNVVRKFVFPVQNMYVQILNIKFVVRLKLTTCYLQCFIENLFFTHFKSIALVCSHHSQWYRLVLQYGDNQVTWCIEICQRKHAQYIIYSWNQSAILYMKRHSL